MFSGGDATSYPETKDWAIKWQPFFSVFLQAVDRRTGSFIHLPFGDGLFDQPAKTMTILSEIQGVFIKHLSESLKGK